MLLEAIDGELRKSGRCRIRQASGEATGIYTIARLEGPQTIAGVWLDGWIELEPDSEEAPILVAVMAGANRLAPIRNLDLLRELLLNSIGGPDHFPTNDQIREWLIEQIFLLQEPVDEDTRSRFHELTFVLGKLVYNGVFGEPESNFILWCDEDGPMEHRRVDWETPSGPTARPRFRGTSRVGPTAPKPHVAIIESENAPDDAPVELVLESAQATLAAFDEGTWDARPEALEFAAAVLTRLDLMASLAARYCFDPTVSIRNVHAFLQGVAEFERSLGVSMDLPDLFGGTDKGPWTEHVGVPTDATSVELDEAVLTEMTAMVTETAGGHLRSVIDTGHELHMNYISHARTRHELQSEIRSLLVDIVGLCAGGHVHYIVSAFRPTRIAGTTGDVSSGAYRSELLTVWAPCAYAVAESASPDLRTLWTACAKSRWIYQTNNIMQKSLLLLHVPALVGSR